MIDEFYKNGLAQDLSDFESFSEDQSKAMSLIKEWWKNSKTEKPYFVLGGCSGSGKSTLIKFVKEELGLKTHEVIYCAFTGKAALVLNRKGMSARTIHSTIYETYKKIINDKVEFFYRKVPAIFAKLIIVDEASMVSEEVFEDLMSFHVPIIFVGDHQQLPPVNSKFNLMLKTDYRMEKVLRQMEDNPIIQLSVKAIRGENIAFKEYGENIKKIHYDDLQDEDLLNAGQILVGTNAKKMMINEIYRELKGYDKYIPQEDEKLIATANVRIISGKCGYVSSQEPIQIFNGQIVYLLKDAIPQKEYFVIEFMDELERLNPIHGALFEPKRILSVVGSDTGNKLLENKKYLNCGHFDYGYAISVHRSQGSSWKDVMVMDDKFGLWESKEMYNRWLYTAITRAEETLTIVAK